MNQSDGVRKIKPFGPRPERFATRWPAHDAWLNILVGAVRSAKTWATLPKILALCHYDVKGLKLIIGKSKQAVYDNILNDLFDIVGPGNYAYSRMTGELRLYDSKWVVIGAKDEGSEAYLRGKTVGIAICDELTLTPKTFFMQLLARMSPAGARLYGTTNCDSPYHWLKTDVLENERYSRGLGKEIWVQTWTMDDNPNLGADYIDRTKRSYSGVFYQRFILGRWVLAEGAIYRDVLTSQTWYHDWHAPEETAACKHCSAGIEMAKQGLRSAAGGYIERYVGIDYGTSNPTVFIECFDDGRTLWADREYYWDSKTEMRQKTDREYADDLEKFVASTGQGKRDAQIILDPSAASFRAELTARGMYVIDADNEVDDGIRMTATMLGRRLLRINVNNVNGRREMDTYAWDEKKSASGVEQPIKQHDHWPDGVRYVVKTKINKFRLAA